MKKPFSSVLSSVCCTFVAHYFHNSQKRSTALTILLFGWSKWESEPNGFDLPFYWSSGVDGSRTRVQKPIPCTSTIIVRYPGRACPDLFPHRVGNEQPSLLSSFMIRPRAQSLTRVVSHIVDARIPRCECPGADKPPEKATSFTAD